MAGPGRRRIEMPGRLFRLAVRDLRAAAAAPDHQFENLGAPEEAMAPPATPGTFDFGLAFRETADTQEAEAETSKKRRVYSIGVESETTKKRSCGSRLCADTFGMFKGKPTGDGEGTFSFEKELGHLKSFKKKHKGTEGLMEIGSPNLVKKITKSKDADESVSPDATQKAKNDMDTLDFLAEMQEKYSLDAYRQKFALTNGLPLPPPSWDQLSTPPIPSSPPPPIVEISNYEEAKSAIRAWSKGCHVHLQVSQQLSLANAEQISDVAKVAQAEQVILNLSVLEAKVSQAKFLRKMIRHTESEIQRFNKMLSLPWMPTQTVPGCNLF
ncbi:hypothetical protein ACQ4PT_022679 [Festuca glaucescens]